MLYGAALHLRISGEVRQALTRANCHTNLIKTNLANKDLVLNRIKMVRKVKVSSRQTNCLDSRRSCGTTSVSSSNSCRILKERVEWMR